MATVKDTLAALAAYDVTPYVKILRDASQSKYLEWHEVQRMLERLAPGYYKGVSARQVGEYAVAECTLTINCDDGSVSRGALGSEKLSKTGYGDPFTNAEAQAFKRAAANLGLGLSLYSKEGADSGPTEFVRPKAGAPGAGTTRVAAQPKTTAANTGDIVASINQQIAAKGGRGIPLASNPQVGLINSKFNSEPRDPSDPSFVGYGPALLAAVFGSDVEEANQLTKVEAMVFIDALIKQGSALLGLVAGEQPQDEDL